MTYHQRSGEAGKETTLEKHVTVLGAIHIAFGVLGVLIAAFLFFVLAGAGWLSQDSEAMVITTSIGTMLSVFLLVLSIPEIIAGLGLLRHAAWARILALVLGVLHLLNIPFGTIVGIYTIWVLMDDRTSALFGASKPVPASGRDVAVPQ